MNTLRAAIPQEDTTSEAPAPSTKKLAPLLLTTRVAKEPKLDPSGTENAVTPASDKAEAAPTVEAEPVEPVSEPQKTGGNPQALGKIDVKKTEVKADAGTGAFKKMGTGATIEADTGPIKAKPVAGGGKGGGAGHFHKRLGSEDFGRSLKLGVAAVRRNLLMVMFMTCATNILILAIPIYLFQISDRVLTSRSIDTLIMLTIVIVGAVVMQAVFDAIRRFILMRTAVELSLIHI